MIGVDISDRSIKVVQLGTKNLHLLGYAWSDVPAGLISKGVINDFAMIQKIIGDTFKKAKISIKTKDTTVASIPETESFLRVVEVPTLADDEVSEMVQWEVARHVPVDVDDMFIDWQWVQSPPTKTSTKQEVLVGAAKKQSINQIWMLLNSLNLDIAALELESIAISRALISSDLKQHQGLLIVDLGGNTANVVIHDRGTIRFTSTIQKGLHDVLAASHEKQQDVTMTSATDSHKQTTFSTTVPAPLMMNLKGLVTEVYNIVNYYNGLNPEQQVKEIILTGGGSNLIGLDQAFLQQFDNVHIQRGNPWVNVLMPGKNVTTPMSLNESVYYSTALGLALRQVIR